MAIKGVSYQLTMRELRYLLFGKKVCPECGGKLAKRKEAKVVEGREVNTRTDPLFASSAEVRKYYDVFKCPCCGTEYELKDLVDRGSGRGG